MITISNLKAILEENGVLYHSYWKKKRLYDLVKNLGLLPPWSSEEKGVKRVSPGASIIKIARPVEFKNVKTGEKLNFSSLYSAGQYVGKSPQTVANWNGRLWREKYFITVGEKRKFIEKEEKSKEEN